MILPLNGGINAGKHCVGEALTRLLAGTAHVEPDDLRHFCSWLPLAAITIALEVAVAVTRGLLGRGMNAALRGGLGRTRYLHHSCYPG